MPVETALETRDLVKTFGKRTVVRSVSLSFGAGRVIGLLGPNGAGKTTIFYMIVGLVQPTSGEILLDGKSLTGMPMYQRARAGIAYLPQEPSIFRRIGIRPLY